MHTEHVTIHKYTHTHSIFDAHTRLQDCLQTQTEKNETRTSVGVCGSASEFEMTVQYNYLV